MDRITLRPDDRADRRSWSGACARSRRPDRPLARPRRRAAAVRGHAALRRLVHGRPAARIGGARARDRRVLADACVRGPRRDRRGRRGCSPRRSTTSTSTTGPAASARGPCWRTPCTCRTASWRASSETGTRVAHCPASNLFLASGDHAARRGTSRPGCRSASARTWPAGPDLSIFARDAGGRLRAERAARRSRGEPRPGRSTPLDWLRARARSAGPGRSASTTSIGSLEAGKEADVIAVDPRYAAPRARHRPDDDPEDLVSRLIFRAHPDMVRAAWVRGRRLEGPGAPHSAGGMRRAAYDSARQGQGASWVLASRIRRVPHLAQLREK